MLNNISSTSPLASIITIVLNGEADIRRTIESVLGQSYPNIEYIVIDGGSEDNTIPIIREYESQIAHFQSEKDAGISDGFNRGIRLASGAIIGLINAGDWYSSNAVESVVELFQKNGDLGVLCGALQFYKGKEKEYCCFSEPRLLKRDMSVTHPSCFVRSELYARFGDFSNQYKLAMDYELLLRFKVNGAQFMATETVFANMEHDGISEENWQDALAETHRARSELLGNSFYAGRIYYIFLVCKRKVRMFLERAGADSVLAFYRSKLALVKKFKT